jgi:hypothetical protein
VTLDQPLELTAFCVRGEPISYADAIRGHFTPIKVELMPFKIVTLKLEP